MFKPIVISRLIVVLCLFGALPLHAQYGWQWQNPLPQGNSLRSIKMIDANTATAVGGGDPVLRTTDGGATWVRQRSGTTNILYGITFTDPMSGTAVGNGGTIVRTDDGGATWLPQTSNTSSNLTAVQNTSVVTGTAVGEGGTIMRTTDSGITWLPQTSNTVQKLNALAFVDFNTGVVVGDSGTVLYTNDGGAVWTKQFAGTISHLLGVAIDGADTIIAVGRNGVIIRSTDAGISWSQQVYDASLNLEAVTLVNSRVGTAIVNDGTVLHTTNGGVTWLPQSSKSSDVLYSVSFVDENTGMIVGDYGTIARTSDGGTTWNTLAAGNTNTLYGASFVNANTGVVVGDSNTIIRTTDGGNNWNVLNSHQNTTLFGVNFTDANTGWAVGSAGTIMHTTNAGLNWVAQSSSITTSILGVCFANPRRGLAVGRQSIILQTTNGGATWTKAPIPNSYPFFITSPLSYVTMIDSVHAFAVGYDEVGSNGIILHTTDAGTTWQNQQSGVQENILSASFIDLNNGMVSGTTGLILVTHDGGAHWTKQITGTTLAVFSVAMLDMHHAYAIGDAGLIMHTTDGGTTWVRHPSGTINFLSAVVATGLKTATAVGFGGTILHTNTGGLVTPLTVSTDEYDFGNVPVDTLRTAKFIVTNSSNNDVTVHPVLTGTIYFTATPDSFKLHPGNSDTITVQYQPNAPGQHNAIIALLNGGSGGTDSIGLAGTGIGPYFQLSANNLDFGDVMVGKKKLDSVVVTNTGNAPLIIEKDSSNDSRFVVASMSDTIAPNASQVFYVTFSAKDTGAVQASLIFSYLGNGSPDTVQLRAHGAPLDFILVTRMLNFGQVFIDSSRTLQILVVNTTGTQVQIDSIVCRDTHYVAQHVYGVAVHDTGRIGVTFTPDTNISVYSWVVIYHNFSTSPDSVQVVGDGTYTRTAVGEPVAAPSQSAMLFNYPNPFGLSSPSTSIAFSLAARGEISLKLFSPLGEEIATIARGMYESGTHALPFTAANLRSGVYYYRLEANGKIATGTMTVVK